jgi:predicted GNAT superfamily acetyltransferase
MDWSMAYTIRILESPVELNAVEALQRQVWPGSEVDIVPMHMLYAAVHSGGLVFGAFETSGPGAASADQFASALVGFVFGFPGFYATPDGPRLKHSSHMLGVHPAHRSRGLGFLLKRAQWQMVRRQGIDRITWTYDPLLSPNGQLNIAKLGAVCSTYHVDFYGEMRDALNKDLPTDRFEVDWWVNSRRVYQRLSKRARRQLDLNQYLAADAVLVNPSEFQAGWHIPSASEPAIPNNQEALLLVEIPANFMQMRTEAPAIAMTWRVHSRQLFQQAFAAGYLVTDFIDGPHPIIDTPQGRCFYVLSHGESTL